MSDGRRFAFILNPSAGRGKALRMESVLLNYLRAKRVKYSFERTTEPLHATRLAETASKDHEVVVAVGGDGTVHEVANGVRGSQASLAVLPLGSGNDFGRLVGMPQAFEHAMETILGGVRKLFDTGKLSYRDATVEGLQEQDFVNSLGIGLDAVVADQARRIKWLRGIPLYMAAVINTLRHLESYDLSIKTDSWSAEKDSFVLCIGNGMYEGGGFKLTPEADPHDGKFHVCVIEAMTALQAMPVIPKLLSGKHGTHEKVMMREARIIEVNATKPFVMHADGEILGKQITHVRAEIRPDAVGVIVPAAGTA